MGLRSVLLICLLPFTGALDPCVDHYYLYETGGRSPACPTNDDHSGLRLEEHWYKVVNLTMTLNMTSEPVKENSCGVRYPIWLNGSHPTVSDNVVKRTVCVASPFSPCYDNYNIQIKNCSGYYVYYLRKTRTYQRGYCFDSDTPCPPPATTTTTLATTTTANDTSDSVIPPIRYPTGYSSYYKFACMMFFGGFLIGALLVSIVVLVKTRRVVSSSQGPSPPARDPGPPSYREAVRGTTAHVDIFK